MKGIVKLMLEQISKNEFLKLNRISNISDEIGNGLMKAYQNQYANKVEELIYLIFLFEIFEEKHVDILNKLLISDWHYQHENIVRILQEISSFKSMQYLYDAIELRPRYIAEDYNHAFELKCVRALYYIGKEKSIFYLDRLCKHPDNMVRKMAQRQRRKLM